MLGMGDVGGRVRGKRRDFPEGHRLAVRLATYSRDPHIQRFNVEVRNYYCKLLLYVYPMYVWLSYLRALGIVEAKGGLIQTQPLAAIVVG